MNDRREDEGAHPQNTIQIPIENDKRKEELEKKLKDSQQKLLDADKAAQLQIFQVQQILTIQSSAIETASESALTLLAIQYFIASILTICIIQLNRFGWLLTWLPFLEQVAGTLYIITLIIVQFCPGTVSELPLSLLTFIIHSCSKILFIIFLSLRYQEFQIELVTLTLGISIFFLITLIKNSVAEKNYQGLKVKKQFCHTIWMAGCVSGFLCLLSRSNYIFIIVLTFIAVVYINVLLLALQRFENQEYIVENQNDKYLGPAVLDSDLLFICKLIGFHCISKKNEDQTNQQQIEKQQNL